MDRAILVLQLQAVPFPARFCGFLQHEKCILAGLSGAIFILGTLILSEKNPYELMKTHTFRSFIFLPKMNCEEGWFPVLQM